MYFTFQGEAQNKQSAVKNLSASLSPKNLKEINGDAPKNSQSMITDTLPQKEKISLCTNTENLLQLEKEISAFPSHEGHSLSPTVTTSAEKPNQDEQSETPEQIKKNTPRPKRACQKKKPVVEELSDIELSFENAHEITLFESPEKEGSRKETPVECSPSKTILKNLFPEEFNLSPVKVVSVEERVLKPRKSYHSPAQFRRHVMKAKKENKVQKKTKVNIGFIFFWLYFYSMLYLFCIRIFLFLFTLIIAEILMWRYKFVYLKLCRFYRNCPFKLL